MRPLSPGRGGAGSVDSTTTLRRPHHDGACIAKEDRPTGVPSKGSAGCEKAWMDLVWSLQASRFEEGPLGG